MAMAMFRLIVVTLIAGFVSYLVGFVLRKFVAKYEDFQFRLSLPIIACCLGAIGALVLMTELMSLCLVDALYHFAPVRQYANVTIGMVDEAGYLIGGYYATKYSVRFAHKLDLRQARRKNDKQANSGNEKSVSEVGRDLLGRNDQ